MSDLTVKADLVLRPSPPTLQERVEPGRFVLADAAVEGDLLIGIPPHRPPTVVKESGLTGDGDWIKVDRGTFETGFERVAAAIAAQLQGGRAPAAFDGKGYCFVEMGKTSAARIEGDFFATPQPVVELSEPSSANAKAKREFEIEHLKKWFGS